MPLPPVAAKMHGFASRNAVPAFLSAGLTAGADMLATPATGEHMPWWAAAGTFAGGMAAARRFPGLRKTMQPLAISGSLLKGTDLLARHYTGYSPFDPKSVERHMGERLGRAAGTAIDNAYSLTDVPQGMDRGSFIEMVRRRLALRTAARQRVEHLFSDG